MSALRDRAIDTAAAWASDAADSGLEDWAAIAEGIIATFEQQLGEQARSLVFEGERAAVIEAAGYVLAIDGIRPELRPPLSSVLERLRAETDA